MIEEFDCIFISYDEENADENWRELKLKIPKAKRVNRVRGIGAAHDAAALLADTPYFFTVDGDNKIEDDFFFKVTFPLIQDAIYVWRCQNAVNGLIYGYGGVKLWDKRLFNNAGNSSYTDHATEKTSIYKIIPSIASITHFNTSPYMSWRSAFRECVKLCLNSRENKDKTAIERLKIWLSVGAHAEHGDWSIFGAHLGVQASLKSSRDELSRLINDYDLLNTIFLANSGNKDLFRECNSISNDYPAAFRNFNILSKNASLLAVNEQRRAFLATNCRTL